MKGTALKIFTRTVTAVGGTVVFYSLASLVGMPHTLEWFLFAVLAILTASFTIKIAGCEATVAVDDTFFMISAMLFGPGPAAVSLAADSCVLSWRKGHDWPRLAFNTVAPALSLWIGGQAFFLLGRIGPLSISDAPTASLLVPLLSMAAVYFVLNSGLMAIAVGLDSRQSPIRIWRNHFLWLSLSYFAAASVALGLVVIIKQVGLLAVAVILPVVAIFHRTLFSSFGRLEDANHHLKQMDRLYLSTVETLAMAIDAKDDVTHSHVRRVQAYAIGLARALGIADEPTIKAIEAAALLHDTGKLGVPEHILNKPGGLTAPEFEQMKRHVDIGADILALVDFPYPVVPIVRCHHENWDGTGYPRGVTGENIPIGARILSVVDCFDALTSDRPYRRALTDTAAIEILLERRGRMYDPRVVDTFIQVYRTIEVSHADKTEQQQVVLDQISRSRQTGAAVPADGPLSPPPHADDNVLAFVSLARLASGAGTLGDMLSLSTKLVRDLAPDVSGGWFMLNVDGDELTATESFGPAAAVLRGRMVRVGERLTGWVAANRQLIINSDAALDLGERGSEPPSLKSCLSVPLMAGNTLVGVLSMYAEDRNAFSEDQGRLLQMVAPHIAVGLDVAKRRADSPPIQSVHATRDLKLVASR
jgi:putative nucleotidyltransferase with HDIG domain